MNIKEAKENLREYLPLLPETAQVAAEFLLKKFDEIVREFNEMKRNAVVQSKVENLPHEIWRNVVGYEGLYQVSSFGRVKSFYGIGERLLTPSANKSGYQYTVLTDKNKIRKSCKVHTLVARTFLPNPENKPVVHHRDSNRANNRVSNLEWVTHRENTAYAVQNGSYDKPDSCASPRAKLTADDVRYIRAHYVPRHREFGANALARKFDVSQSTILNVVHYVTYN
ncbi:MAG: NUMOD4 motif-containing HNH endonuclease [Selenomonadaceae bacterium]|nr:NUMOD4 motif-containing HNH endonuclease [Selenomonadaceae bacterium]